MKRVIPSSKASATWWDMGWLLDVVDIDDVVNVVVLENDLLLGDLHRLTTGVDGQEGVAVVRVGVVVPEVVGDPVEADIHFTVTLFQDLHVGDVVHGAWLRQGGGGGTLGADTEHTVLEATAVWVEDQGDLGLGVFGDLTVVVPGRHPEFRVLAVALQPVLETAVVEEAGF